MLHADLDGLRQKLNDGFREIAENVERSRDTTAGTSNSYAKVINKATGANR
jgi:hypothetical protein